MRTALSIERLECRDLPAAAFQTLPVLPFSNLAVTDHVRAIFARGQELGRNANAFMRVGDSNTSTANIIPKTYLTPLGLPGYNPITSGLPANLLATWEIYRTPIDAQGENSFDRLTSAAYPGWTSADALGHLGEEAAITDAGLAFIMIGTNDIGTGVNIASYRQNLEGMVGYLVSQGIVPILSTVPNMLIGDASLHARLLSFNQVIANVAAENRVPFWNLYDEVVTLPNDGVGSDEVHLLSSPDGSGSFNSQDLEYGQNVRNLEALEILNWFRNTVMSGPTFIAPNATWQMMSVSSDLYAVGHDEGFSPTVDVYNADTGMLVNRFLAFGKTYGGGVRVATGDVNGDGFTDVICATNGGTTARVRVFSGQDGSLLANLTPFAGYTGALSVAVGDLDGDGVPEIVVGKATGGSAIRVYEGGTFTQTSTFHAFPRIAGGVSVAVANVSGDGAVIAVGSSQNPTLRLFDADGSLVSSFHVFKGSGLGITVAAADLDDDGTDEIAVARTTGANKVRVLNPTSKAVVATFTVSPVSDSSFGIRLGTLRRSSGSDMLLVGNSPGSAVALNSFDDLSGTAVALRPTNAARAYGIFVG
jgi:GDSL-like Lipase/Acylhydrolase family/FG-GAP-like repeat